MPLRSIEKLFPFILVVDQQGELLFIGKSMLKLAPDLKEKQLFEDNFSTLPQANSAPELNFEQMLSKMTVIQEKKTKAKFRGQWIRPSRKLLYAFIGSLSVTDPAELKDLGLNFGDFPIQDQIFDYLMLSQTQKRSISEAEIANRKLADAHKIAVQASETKSQFLANMSHELRTPMNGVLGMASVLKEGTELNSEQTEYVENIIQSGDAMLALINDILDLTKVESGFIQLHNESLSIADLIAEVVSVIQVSAQKKGNSIILKIEDGVPAKINADRLRLRQILLNIVGNANKFTKDGRILINVTRVKESSSLIRFAIEDTGLGMSEDVQVKIFNPFVQGDSSMNKKFGGTGLGLSICKKLTEAMGGGIRCESAEGLGSKFEFEIDTNNETEGSGGKNV